VEINSCLYWAKKKFTLADTEKIKDETAIVLRVELAAGNPPTNDPKEALKLADDFARIGSDNFLKAIRYFEVADRYVGTPESIEAQRRSLDWLSKVSTAAKPVAAPSATSGDGAAQLVGTWNVKHREWSGVINLLANGEFTGGGVRGDGRWSLANRTLTLHWANWAAEDVTVESPVRMSSGKMTMSRGPTTPAGSTTRQESIVNLTTNDMIVIYPEDCRLTGSGASTTIDSHSLYPHDLPGRIVTSKLFTPPFTFEVVATPKSQIRLYLGDKQIIFGWEENPLLLVVKDPVGAGDSEILGKGLIKPNTQVRLAVTLNVDSMKITKDGVQVFSKQADYSGFENVVGVGTHHHSTVKIDGMRVIVGKR